MPSTGTKNGGVAPAMQRLAKPQQSSCESTLVDDAALTAVKASHDIVRDYSTTSTPVVQTYSIDRLPPQLAQHHFTTQSGLVCFYVPLVYDGVIVEWKTDMWEHSNDHPFCQVEACMCHFHPQWLKTFFWQPIEQGRMSIEQGLDLYHCREAVLI
jgi:hypothetical protein